MTKTILKSITKCSRWLISHWWILLLLGVFAYITYLLTYLSLPPFRTPLFLLTRSQRIQVCSDDGILRELYDLKPDRFDAVETPTDRQLNEFIDEFGAPSGYVYFIAFSESRCYFIRLYWFDEGMSIRTPLLPRTEKISSDVIIEAIEYFEPVENIEGYEDLFHYSEGDLTSRYHEWVDIDSIMYD